MDDSLNNFETLYDNLSCNSSLLGSAKKKITSQTPRDIQVNQSYSDLQRELLEDFSSKIGDSSQHRNNLSKNLMMTSNYSKETLNS